jgi:hypothetical protein
VAIVFVALRVTVHSNIQQEEHGALLLLIELFSVLLMTMDRFMPPMMSELEAIMNP